MNSKVIRKEKRDRIIYYQGKTVIKVICKNGYVNYGPKNDKNRIQRKGRPDLITPSGFRYWTCGSEFIGKDPRV
jgi:hypothetical protein